VSTDMLERTVAKRQDVTVKLDSEVVRTAKIVAAYRGLTVADYLSESLRPIAQRDLLKEQAKATPAKAAKPKTEGGD
jgi:predicted DNA binding CopG/RHH family protein